MGQNTSTTTPVGPGRQGGSAPTGTATPGSGKNNAEISGVSVGPGRPTQTGGDTVKAGGAGGSSNTPPGGKPGAPALAPGESASGDETTAKKRAAPAEDAPAKAAVKTDNPAAPSASKPAPDAAPNAAGATAATAPAAARVLAAPAPAAATAAVATGAAAAATVSYSHNNSAMKLVPDGDVVRLIYDKPRDGLEPLGIKPGTPLFEGKKTGANTSAGEATTFSRTCGTAKFPVAGEAQGGTVTLRGQKPVRDGDCKVSGYTGETLTFEAK